MKRKYNSLVANVGKNIVSGVFFIFIFFLIIITINKDIPVEVLFLKETFPLYNKGLENDLLMNILPFGKNSNSDVILASNIDDKDSNSSIDNNIINNIEFDDSITSVETIGLSNVEFQTDTKTTTTINSSKEELTVDDIQKLKDFDFLKSKFYIIDKRTDLTPSDIDVDEFLSKDLTIHNEQSGPKVLIFHTHSQEAFVDSIPNDVNDGIFIAGEKLANVLESKYGIKAIHHKGQYDVVNGSSMIEGAYERVEPKIKEIIEQYPSIEVLIDLHRDGVKDSNKKFLTYINGKPTAQIMFFNGLCKMYNNGKLENIDYLPSSNVRENLNLSFRLQLSANKLFPTFTRKVYLNAYRYSLHMKPKSLLIELGAQTNTKEEILNAIDPLAEVLASVLLK